MKSLFSLLLITAISLLAQSSAALIGAGATFPYPIYSKWFDNYRRENPTSEILYQPVGSEAGVRKLLSGEVDFGASDSPEILHDTAPDREGEYLLLPSVVGAVVPIVNLPGFAGDLKFTSETLAGIYLGKIKNWNDPLIKSGNHGVSLPELPITVVHRSDGSGTSYAWTDFLSRTDAGWKAQVGCGMSPQWPVGRGAEGNDGVAKLVAAVPGAIGYVEFIYALKSHLSFAEVKNHRGRFIQADLSTIAAAASSAGPIGSNFKVSLADSVGADAYPIATFSWLIVPKHLGDNRKRQAMKDFLSWMLGPGQRQAAALGYVELPPTLVAAEQAELGKLN